MTKAYMDEYMGYILTNQEGVRFAKNSNGENVFGNDQEFLNWHAKQIEQYETAGYQAIGGNTNWSESTAKYYKLGKLTLDGGKFNGRAYVNVNGELKEATSIKQLAEEWAKDDNNKLNDVRIAGKTTAWCIQNNNSCKNENNTRSLIHQAMNGTGVQFQGIMPGGKNSGSFKVRVKVNAETTGDENYEGEKHKIETLEKLCFNEGLEPVLFNLSEYMKSGAMLSCMMMHLNYVDHYKSLI